MIISASRRTDLPAHYTPWLMNRFAAGYCEVPNPFNPKQISRIPLHPEGIDAVVFWTRNPAPLIPRLPELDDREIVYYFLFTLLDYPRAIDPGMAPLVRRIETFRELSDRIGPDRVVWRYDPIFLSSATGPDFHRETVERISRALAGATRTCVVSLTDIYRKVRPRLAALERETGIRRLADEEVDLPRLMTDLSAIVGGHGMEIWTCAETPHPDDWGIPPGRCIDPDRITAITGRPAPAMKDPSQRPFCRCVVSRDIGMYDTCPAGCVYCYAVGSAEKVRKNRSAHDPEAPSLVPG